MRLIALELAPLTLGKDDIKTRKIQNLRKSSRFTPPPPPKRGKVGLSKMAQVLYCILVVVDA